MGAEEKRSMTEPVKSGKPPAVALVSGGLDSCVTAAMAARSRSIYALHASYGQRTQNRERRAFREIAERLGAAGALEVDLSVLAKMGSSSLLNKSVPIPEGEGKTGEIPTTYVPFRNGVLLSVAAAWAESLGAGEIFIGAVAPDAPQGYPDTTREFFDALERAILIGTRPETKIKIMAPAVDWPKHEVVEKGLELGAPLELTWSCYAEEDEACGKCLSCESRLKAFREAGVEDPIPYKHKHGKRKRD